MRLKVLFYRTRKGWRWRASTITNTVVGASTEGYAQRISCRRNFRLVTGLPTPGLPGRAPSYEFYVKLGAGQRTAHWQAR